MKYLAVISFAFLAACSSPVTKIVEKPVAINRPAPVLPTVQPITQQTIEWIIITEDNVQEILAKLEADNKRIVFFAVTPENYEVLMMNIGDVRRYIMQQGAVLAAYKQYVETPPELPKEAPKAQSTPFWKVW